MDFALHFKQSLELLLPETILLVTFVAAIILDLIFKKSRHIGGAIALIGFVATFISMITLDYGEGTTAFVDLMSIDAFGDFFKYLILISSFVVVIMTFFSDEMKEKAKSMGEYYTLIIGMTFGMFLLCSASNLIMIYLAIETMSLSSYVLTGYLKEIKRSSEASLKYVIFGALASGVMIYGISILFGLTGTLDLAGVQEVVSQYDGNSLALVISGLMILMGFAYKISAVPFHYWTPDVYEGAPVTITAYLSVASKAAGFAALIRFLMAGFSETALIAEATWETVGAVNWQHVVAFLSIITMTFGNLAAIWQENAKRLLAYSSIAHAGYMLMGVVVMTELGIAAVLAYFLFYLIMNFGAFYIVMLVANKTGSEDLESYVGFGFKAPALGVFMTIFMVSLTGIPPTAGFIGKWYLFSAVLDAGWIWLAVIGVLNSVVSLYYYAKIFRNMWLRGSNNENKPVKYNPASQVLLYVLGILTLFFGLYWTPVINWAQDSVKIFVGF